MQYDINSEVAKTSALLSVKIDKYKYLTGEEILPSGPSQIIQQVYISSLRKICWKTNRKTGWTFEVFKAS